MIFSVNGKQFNYEFNDDNNIKINSSRKIYDVNYTNNNIENIINEIYVKDDFIFIDRNVYNLSPNTFNNLSKILIFDANEDNKNIENVLKLIDELYKSKITKKNKLLVIGGGITQDVGGFAAGIFKRGIKWVLVPTTILSMTDSCIGSKVSINRNSKNMLGFFSAPDKIIISTVFFNTLSPDDMMSGLGESLKLCLIGGHESYEYFKTNYESNNYMNIIKISSIIKKQLIEFDEFDENERKVLNYGHSIGHALECATNFYIPHGIAVLIGMYIKNVLFYGEKYNEINNFILEMVNKKFFETSFDYDIFINHLLSDKKNDGNDICFILLNEIGKTIITYKKLDDFYIPLKKTIADLFKK
jgi:3-dehydroquinate synthase